MSYCQSKKKAIVGYLKSNNIRERFVSLNPPINVSIDQNVSNCWRFFGRGDDAYVGNPPDKDYELFASGNNPGYKPSSNGRGVTPTMDGVLIAGEGYWYRSNYEYERVSEVVRDPTRISGGSCTSLGNSCQITITDVLGNKHSDLILCPNGQFSVSCDDECPPGHCKCTTVKYPGYCCIPCKEVATRINNLAARI